VSNLSITLILGIPIVLIAVAIGLMIWRALYPRRNRVPGFTDRNGTIVNPYFHLAVSLFCALATLYSGWRLLNGPQPTWSASYQKRERLEVVAQLLIGAPMAFYYFKKFKRFKKPASSADA
jgi:hypothetical protein